jgi:hypothetical protein
MRRTRGSGTKLASRVPCRILTSDSTGRLLISEIKSLSLWLPAAARLDRLRRPIAQQQLVIDRRAWGIRRLIILPRRTIRAAVAGSLSGAGAAVPVMFWDRHTATALCGLAALLIGATILLADAPAVFAPVAGMVAGIGGMALANDERQKLRIAALERRIAQAEWRDSVNRADAA